MLVTETFTPHDGSTNPFADDRLKRLHLQIMTVDGLVPVEALARVHQWDWNGAAEAPLGAVVGWAEMVANDDPDGGDERRHDGV